MPIDKVTPVKQESGGDDVDYLNTPLQPNEDAVNCRGVYIQYDTGDDTSVLISRDASGNLTFKDAAYPGGKTLTDTLAAGSGVTESQHEVLLQLIHFIDEGPAEGFTTGATKTVTGTVFPTQVLWKRSDDTKLVEKNITWTGAFPTTIQWKMYAADGTAVLATVTDTISYSGPFETGRSRAIA
jgi:hypothetical protein